MAPPLPTFTQINSAISDTSKASSNSHNALFTGNNLGNTTYSSVSKLVKSQANVRITLSKKNYTSPLSNETHEGSHITSHEVRTPLQNKIVHNFSNNKNEARKINYVELFEKFDVKSKLTRFKILKPSKEGATDILNFISKECLGQHKNDKANESQMQNPKSHDLSSADSDSMLCCIQSGKNEAH